jgi:hypothetical protein
VRNESTAASIDLNLGIFHNGFSATGILAFLSQLAFV